LIIDNYKGFEDEQYKTLLKTLEAFQLRTADKGSEYWLYLMQWIAAYKTEDVKARDFAAKAYKHPNTPDSYKSILKKSYEDF
jgi:hypothetical protein